MPTEEAQPPTCCRTGKTGPRFHLPDRYDESPDDDDDDAAAQQASKLSSLGSSYLMSFATAELICTLNARS